MAILKIKDGQGQVHEISAIRGDDGVGISNIAKTSTSGKVDTYTITLSNGTTKTFTVNNGNDGAAGADGISVSSATINSSGHLIITLSNSTIVDAGVAKGSDGQDGDDGVSVTGVTINSSGHLIVTLSSGSTIDAGVAKGEKGDTGDSGVYIGSTPPTDPTVKVWIDTSGAAGDVEMTTNKVTSISSSSTDTQYPSAKAVYTEVSARYTKPSGGIPSSDMTSAVQTSLGKADSALQSHQSLSAYRTSSAQDTIDNAQTARIDDIIEKLKGNVYKTEDGASPAYIQSVPANSQSYSMLGMIGGKTVGWNQIVTRHLNETFTLSESKSSGWIGQAYSIQWYVDSGSFVNGHKYFGYLITNAPNVNMADGNVGTNVTDIFTAGSTAFAGQLALRASGYISAGTYSVKYYLTDLTAMFGAGNEPTSITDPRIAWIKAYASAHPEYNAGSLLSAKTDAVKSVGANIWDEEWELGVWNTSGQKVDSSTNIRSKNYIPVIPNSVYYIKVGTTATIIGICYFDANKAFIWRNSNAATDATITIPGNCCYIAFNTATAYGTTYNHDIQICLNSYAEKTTYHPYKSDSFPIPSAVKSLAGYGQSAGNVYNYVEIEPKTYRNMKSVDLATLNWGGSAGAWTATLANYNGSPLHASIPNTAFTYSGTTLTVASTAQPTGILHYQSSDNTGTDYEARLYHKRVGSYTFTGNENWIEETVQTGKNFFVYITLSKGGQLVLTNKYPSSYVGTAIRNQVFISNAKNFNAPIDGYNSLAEWKQYLSNQYSAGTPLIVNYELATEQLLDVTSYFSGDVFIEVENGGTVEFHQEGGAMLEIPNKNVYLVDVFGGY